MSKVGFDPDGNYRGLATTPSYVVALFFNLADIANGSIFTSYVFGHKGAIVGMDFRVGKAVTTAAKLTTLTPSIGGVNLTGGVVSLTSANATPAGAAVAGTAVTALNTFTATDALTITASATTAFVEGNGCLLLKIVNLE